MKLSHHDSIEFLVDRQTAHSNRLVLCSARRLGIMQPAAAAAAQNTEQPTGGSKLQVSQSVSQSVSQQLQ